MPILERTQQHQYVMNINTGAWCRFTGINAGCWSLLGDNLYFGGNDGVVCKFDCGHLDGASNITGTLQSAYGTFGSVQTKRYTMARPLFLAPSGYNPPVTIQTDYDTSEPAVNMVSVQTGGTQWNAGAMGHIPVGRRCGALARLAGRDRARAGGLGRVRCLVAGGAHLQRRGHRF